MLNLAVASPLKTTPVALTHRCRALGIARATLYRRRHRPAPADGDMELREVIQRLAVEDSSGGYRRITRELARRGVVANHKRVLRLMREDNLLCLRKRRFVVTTDSDHNLPIYPNLAHGLVPSRPDELWVADITYIRLVREFIYLAVILDAWSRRVIGWSLGRTLEDDLTLAALRRALATRRVTEGLIHHSDRGVQYASTEYTKMLKDHKIRISMSRRANPYDNAKAESFIKTLKYEQVYLDEYETFEQARARIGHFLEEVYNKKRLHSALGYRPPVEFEQHFAQTALTAVSAT